MRDLLTDFSFGQTKWTEVRIYYILKDYYIGLAKRRMRRGYHIFVILSEEIERWGPTDLS